jgi:RNA recognition motif-containing protein
MNIYVGNLPLEITEDELRQEFTAFGQVISVSVMNDKYIGSGQPRGYGFVEMASKSEGAVAVAGLNGKTIRGRLIGVVEALPLSDNKDKRSFHSRRGSHFSVKRQRGYRE